MKHHYTLKRDSPFFLDAFTPTMAALFSLPMLLLLRENCREVTSSCPVVHVREIECLTGRELTNTKRLILANSFYVF